MPPPFPYPFRSVGGLANTLAQTHPQTRHKRRQGQAQPSPLQGGGALPRRKARQDARGVLDGVPSFPREAEALPWQGREWKSRPLLSFLCDTMQWDGVNGR